MIKLSKRAEKFEASGIRALFDQAQNLKDPISFAIGQPDFGPSEKVKKRAIEAIEQDISSYTSTQGMLPLRMAIAEKLKSENNITSDPEDIIVTPGTSAAFFLTLSTILDPGDEVIIPEPYFVEYPMLVQFLEAKPVFLDTYEDNFQINIEKLKNLITTKTKAIILNTPNNPTGSVYQEEILKEIALIAEKHNLIIIADEIYEKFIYDNLSHFSIGSVYPNTVTLGGLSKSGGMPGWRLAWASGPKEIISKMKDIQQYTFVQAPSIVQYAAQAAFEDERDLTKIYQQKRDLVCEILSQKYDVKKPQGAFYLMLDVKNGIRFAEWALSQNILVVPGNAFSRRDTHIRISYATSEDKIKKGLEILKNFPS